MALSEYERKMLEQLEAQLADDPHLAESLASQARNSATHTSLSPKHLVIGLIIAMLGLSIVAGGVALDSVLLGIGGVLVVFAGFWYVAGGVKKTVGPPRATNSSFMERQMQEWMKRQQG